MRVEQVDPDRWPTDWARGDATGLAMPAHPEALRQAGEGFLTHAFRAFGSIGADNAVARITRCEACPGGSTGKKLFLSVEYARPDPALDTELFVKFSRDFDDPVRDARGKYELEGEVRMAAVSRLPGFPITVCTAYFADYEAVSNTGLLITRRVAFGRDGIEPHHAKCMDHMLDHAPHDAPHDALAHYRTIVRALARIAARFAPGSHPRIDAAFPYDPERAAAANAVSDDAATLRDRVRRFAAFAAAHPQLYPPGIASPELFAKIERQIGGFVTHEGAIRRFLQGDPRLIALCHWNAHIDNAWFWRDEAGELQCGLMDWGCAGRMNVAFSLWGCLSGAEPALWDRHLDALLALFARELHRHGGPAIAVAELKLHLNLYVALMGLTYFLDTPSRIAARLPEFARASGPRDPMIQECETVRNQLSISAVFLNLWRRHDLGASLDQMLARPGTVVPPLDA